VAGDHIARRRRLPWLRGIPIVAATASIMAASCGQYQGVHDQQLGPAQTAATSTPVVANGENNAPGSSIRYTVITVTTTARHPTAGPFRLCPVQGRGAFSDDFGAPRFSGGYHPHGGNDILAALGTPILAPFDGTAVQTPNGLGGQAVTVYGAAGYVYNAHLSAYGRLGPVHTGDVVGYVGNTGDAAGGPTHDHFEWHPKAVPAHPHVSPYGYAVISGAIDPYPFLVQVCTSSSH
jgi:murein DD-endopeptidase MepM/ murein hydrolase activator NlpD